jgi:hypothetical protein
MKKAELICKNQYNENKDEDGIAIFYTWEVIRAIKEAQKDAIRETIKACSSVINDKYTAEHALLYTSKFSSLGDKLIKEL